MRCKEEGTHKLVNLSIKGEKLASIVLLLPLPCVPPLLPSPVRLSTSSSSCCFPSLISWTPVSGDWVQIWWRNIVATNQGSVIL